jgi:uncharacterized protein with von Willebrand factor type A (vWA) domain
MIDEFLWTLRREEFDVTTSQALDVARALREIGFEDRWAVREAIACIVVGRARDRRRFDDAFQAFFGGSADTEPADFWARLPAGGFTDVEVETLRAVLVEAEGAEQPPVGSLVSLLGAGADFDRLLTRAAAALSIDAHSELQLGYEVHRFLRSLGADRAHTSLRRIRTLLVGAMGTRGAELADLVARELERAEGRARAHVRRIYDARVRDLRDQRRTRGIELTPFAAMDDTDADSVRAALRLLAEHFRGAARVRRRRGRRGVVDAHRTLRRSFRTAGIPVSLVRRRRVRDRPKLLLLCDVSDSVRPAVRFLLEFAVSAQELFENTRTFLFVSDIEETTRFLRRPGARSATHLAWIGMAAKGHNSNYGNALRTFEQRCLSEIDRRTTVVILGDGRGNYRDAAADVLDRIRERANALIWLCPEPRGHWSHGDSAMNRYAPKCSAALEVTCAADFQRVARQLVSRRSLAGLR